MAGALCCFPWLCGLPAKPAAANPSHGRKCRAQKGFEGISSRALSLLGPSGTDFVAAARAAAFPAEPGGPIQRSRPISPSPASGRTRTREQSL